MAGLTQRKDDGAWQVTWREEGRQRARRFKTEEEGRRFIDTLPAPSPRRGGKKALSRAQVIDKLAANFEVNEDGCWLWTGPLSSDGYARLNWKQHDAVIPGGHRIVLHAIGQPVPRNLVVDHLCRMRHCINPDHLEPVAQRENVYRSPVAPGALNAAKTHCAQGHQYTPENTAVLVNPSGRKTVCRVCKECRSAWRRKATAKYRAKRAAGVAA